MPSRNATIETFICCSSTKILKRIIEVHSALEKGGITVETSRVDPVSLRQFETKAKFWVSDQS